MTSKAETEASGAPGAPISHVLVAFVDGTTLPIELPEVGTLTLGRSSACQIVLDHPSISREHARFGAGDAFTVEDLGSRNGTRVRGVPLAPRMPATLHPGDVVECGDATILLRTVGSGHGRKSTVPSSAPAAFAVGAEGRSLRAPNADVVNLGRRGALRRVLLSLARKRIESPGVGLSVDDLLAAGWPGEKMSYEAGVARVYTTIQRLRALGLHAALVTRDDGYLVDPSATVCLEEG